MSFGISNAIFALVLIGAILYFSRNVSKIRRNIFLGRTIDRTDNKGERWKTMMRVALGQSKMVVRPVAGLMHILIYLGFVLINLEVLEIVLDGLFGAHRLFAGILGGAYDTFINFFEFLGFLVLFSCVVFLLRRNIQRLGRFHKPEMKGWPTKDANYILIFEIVLMMALFTMNASDSLLMQMSSEELAAAGLSKYDIGLNANFFFSSLLHPLLPSEAGSLYLIERIAWWFHIVGILGFMNYLPFSKHFHIILAFPNTWYSNLKAKGRLTNLESVKKEVELMMDPSADPFAAPAPAEGEVPQSFGAKDVADLNWVQLMGAYSCTECGRCTSECPANQTGKLLSPRKIMMDTRDRLEEVGKNIDKHGADHSDGKSLLHDYIKPEELWACTTCNACVEACPVNIDPLSIIVDLRRFMVMEESAAPSELNGMFTNIENNAAPWQFAQADRLNWVEED
jgi:ferredoxin